MRLIYFCIFLSAKLLSDHLPPTKEEVYVLPMFVCLSVCDQDYSKRCAWIWMKCCVSTDVGTWTN